MSFTIATHETAAGGKSATVYTLASDTTRAEIWPAFGFNCLRWQIRTNPDTWGDLLYTAPDWETNPVPTRSGHPILFPFPNRLRFGRFVHEGKTYQLPLTESTGTHAIHGFAPRKAWRVIAQDAGPDFAAITGEFTLTNDFPEALAYWPSDFTFRLTYRLSATTLRVEADVTNPGVGTLPFGIGYHPYFRMPTLPDAVANDMLVWSPAASLWEAENSLATGVKVPVPSAVDFRTPRAVGTLALDTLLGDLPKTDDLAPVAWLGHPATPGRLVVAAPSSFRELLLFTPTHRKAIAIEPYTCTTDAANFSPAGLDAGWRTLAPGGQFIAAVEYRWLENGQ